MQSLTVNEEADVARPAPSPNRLAELLRTVMNARMRDLGLTQSELGRRVGITSASVNQLVHGSTDGLISTWSKILDALDRDALETYATGSLNPTQLTRPLGPRLVSGEYYADLTYAMHDVGVKDGVRIFQIDLPVAQLEDLLNGRALFQVDRVYDRTAIAFAPAAEVAGYPHDGQEIGQEIGQEAGEAEAFAEAEEAEA